MATERYQLVSDTGERLLTPPDKSLFIMDCVGTGGAHRKEKSNTHIHEKKDPS